MAQPDGVVLRELVTSHQLGSKRRNHPALKGTPPQRGIWLAGDFPIPLRGGVDGGAGRGGSGHPFVPIACSAIRENRDSKCSCSLASRLLTHSFLASNYRVLAQRGPFFFQRFRAPLTPAPWCERQTRALRRSNSAAPIHQGKRAAPAQSAYRRTKGSSFPDPELDTGMNCCLGKAER